ncbi:MAG: DUF1365 domain-containing protein [Candidatus Pelagibacterales bacterium]|nr:MAG: DUF1365 domain-containing protein [Pelagibacterales bacterium]
MSFFSSCIYSGIVTHRRLKPKRHFFSYKTFSLFIDLSEIVNLEKKIKFFSYNKFNILSFYNIDHGPRDGSSLVKWVKKILAESKIDTGLGAIKLLCFPRFFGYVFNPLSIFYCYDEKSQLKAVLYEVKNTFNEQHTYVFPVSQSSNLILHRCDKKFYVSPFIEMKTFYNFRLLKPGNVMSVFIKQADAEGALLIACQTGKRLEMNNKNLFFQFLKHPLMSFKIILAIHFEAFRLWIKGIRYVKRKIKIKNNLSLEK